MTEETEAEEIVQKTVAFHVRAKKHVEAVGALCVDAFHILALFAIGATTVWAAFVEFFRLVGQGHAGLADILLLFIYLEIGAMVGIYFKTTRMPVRYLIYIAITALARILVEVVGAEHKIGYDILILTGAILILSLAVLVLRYGSYRFPSDSRVTDEGPSKAPGVDEVVDS